jgi:hypothetical protein
MALPLTAELLAKRMTVLFTRLLAEGGPADDVLFEVLRCDGCERTVNLLLDGHPAGWSTEGDFTRGWRDLCEDCGK